ncbi:MAG: Lrp/AsnC family transcriptional regulator [Actinomycetota bacterium]
MAVEFPVLDEIDREILRLLEADARLTQRELGRLVGLSPNAAGARTQRLIERGVITGFHARIDHAALGRGVEASIDVWQRDDEPEEEFRRLVADDDRVVECIHLTGPLDFRVRARVSSSDDLYELLQRMKNEGGVRSTDSRLVLNRLPVLAPAPIDP